MIPALILAAGASTRMGSPKALLRIGDRTFLQHIFDTLQSASVPDVMVVLGSDSDAIRKTMGWFRGTILINDRWQEGQLSSLRTGLDGISSPRTDGVIICPVDHPLFSGALMVEMLEAFHRSGKPIILPVHNGRNGHPVIVHRSLFDELRSAPPGVGARAVVQRHRNEVFPVSTRERGVVTNIDTIQDYQAHCLPVQPR
jgi:molybdenum cofactor cytidylyltransferase